MTITVQVDSQPVVDALSQLLQRGQNLAPALKEIGEDLAESTKRRFATSTGPDGEKWAANSNVTILQYLGGFKGSYKKDGSLTKKGTARLGAKKPLIGESRALSTTITYRVEGNTLSVGSPMVYAAMQQFGGTKSSFTHLWGDIPARPFLGLSAEDERNILEILSSFLDS